MRSETIRELYKPAAGSALDLALKIFEAAEAEVAPAAEQVERLAEADRAAKLRLGSFKGVWTPADAAELRGLREEAADVGSALAAVKAAHAEKVAAARAAGQRANQLAEELRLARTKLEKAQASLDTAENDLNVALASPTPGAYNVLALRRAVWTADGIRTAAEAEWAYWSALHLEAMEPAVRTRRAKK